MKAMSKTSRIRIIGGLQRRQIIQFPDRPALRPTPDRVRETLFNWLGQDLTGKTCLDLFAGSGVLGFEALSRGAIKVVMVEHDSATFASLQQNAKRLALEKDLKLVKQDALTFIAQPQEKFDLIFLDPPYQSNYLSQVLTAIPKFLTAEGLVYVESPKSFKLPSEWQILRQGQAGQVCYQLIQWNKHD